MQTHPETNFRRCCNVARFQKFVRVEEKKDTGPRYSYLLVSNEGNNTFRIATPRR